MVTEEEIAELMKTPEGMQILRSMMEDQDEGEAMTAASGYDNDGMSPEDRMAFDAMNNEAPIITPMPGMPPQAGEQIGASPDTLGATRGLPPETIGASPDIPGATRGLPLGVSGINAEEENKRRMMEQLLRNQLGN
jgi:hypothetical protein